MSMPQTRRWSREVQHAPQSERGVRAASVVLALLMVALLLGVGWGWLASGGLFRLAVIGGVL